MSGRSKPAGRYQSLKVGVLEIRKIGVPLRGSEMTSETFKPKGQKTNILFLIVLRIMETDYVYSMIQRSRKLCLNRLGDSSVNKSTGPVLEKNRVAISGLMMLKLIELYCCTHNSESISNFRTTKGNLIDVLLRTKYIKPIHMPKPSQISFIRVHIYLHEICHEHRK